MQDMSFRFELWSKEIVEHFLIFLPLILQNFKINFLDFSTQI